MPLSDLFLNQIQPGIAAFTGVPTAPPAGPIVMTPENQAAMQRDRKRSCRERV